MSFFFLKLIANALEKGLIKSKGQSTFKHEAYVTFVLELLINNMAATSNLSPVYV